jgi:hypothetical protein
LSYYDLITGEDSLLWHISERGRRKEIERERDRERGIERGG